MNRQSGFTLVELAIAMLIIGLLLGMIMPASSALIDQQHRKETALKMAGVDQALLAYVSTNRRLPCPADGTIPSGMANVGAEARDGSGDCTAQATGVVPWATLGLSEADVTDGWSARLTYRVPDNTYKPPYQGVTRNGAMDASLCDPAGSLGAGAAASACSAACNHAVLSSCTNGFSIVLGRGLLVVDEATNKIMDPAIGTGAAYVVISPMSEGGGGYSSSGSILPGSVAAGTTGEIRNANGQGIPAAGFFHDSRIILGSSAAHFDDVLSHPSIMQLLTKANLAPRSQ